MSPSFLIMFFVVIKEISISNFLKKWMWSLELIESYKEELVIWYVAAVRVSIRCECIQKAIGRYEVCKHWVTELSYSGDDCINSS